MKSLLKYVTAWNGIHNDFYKVEHLYDALYHDDFIFMYKDGFVLDRHSMKDCHADFFRKGFRFNLTHFRQIGSDRVDFQVRVRKGREDRVLHVVSDIDDGKIARSEVVDFFDVPPRVRLARSTQTKAAKSLLLQKS